MRKPTYDELQAQVDVLRDALSSLMASIGGGKKFCGHDFDCVCAGDKARNALATTPAACLAEVRAEAGRAGYAECALDFGLCSTDEQRVNIVKQADAYAESIRQGGTS